jgi:hypothetical protein
MKLVRAFAAFSLLVLSLTSLTLAQTSDQTAPSKEAVSPAVSGTGTTDFIPLWTNSTGTLGNSIFFQSGTGSSAKVGMNSTTPQALLDVNGSETVRGLLNLPATGTATATAGTISRPFGMVASAFNSGTGTAANQVFHWQAEPVNNNTSSASATLNLLFGVAPAAAAETGLKINSNGTITFAPGQSFAGGSFCIAVGGGFGSGGTTFVGPSFSVPAPNSCSQWSGYTKTASTVILNTSGAACLSSTGKTLTVSVSSADPDFEGAGSIVSDYIQLTRSSSTGTFSGGSDQGEFAGSANQITCTASLLTLPDSHD